MSWAYSAATVHDLQDFFKKACLRWKIDIEYSQDLW